jgi:SAM-dependent methyltransferase
MPRQLPLRGPINMLADFQCRSCESRNGDLVLDLGEQPLANNLLAPGDLANPEPQFPLRLSVCTDCWLLQITDLVPAVELFSDYVYFSSYSETWVAHTAACAERYLREFTPKHVVEIASNDGCLLRHFAEAGVSHLGIEPAENVAAIARENGVSTHSQFFTERMAKGLADEKRADLILANNVFAHAPDINDFVAGLHRLLSKDGSAILEFPHALEMFVQGEFDTIYHEHVFYFTLTALQPLMARHNLRITRVESIPIHGGSMRIYMRHVHHSEDETVAAMLQKESDAGVTTKKYYEDFSKRAQVTKSVLETTVFAIRKTGERVAAYGAAAKGSTLLNFCNLNSDDIEFVADRSPHKHGRLTPGSHIPIVPAEELAERAPDVTLLLAWNFADEILEQQSAYREAGGRFLIPIPESREV